MTWDVALILGVDGLANGAVYLLAGLGIVLVFSVTRVVFVPFGDIAVFAAMTVAAFEAHRVPPTIALVALVAALATIVEVVSLLRRREAAKVPKALLMYGVLPAIPCAFAAILAAGDAPHALLIAAAILLVVPIGPLVARLVIQPIADASMLVLLIASIALHYLLSGLGLLFFGPEGSRTAALAPGSFSFGDSLTVSGQVVLMVASALVLSALFFVAFERTVAGKALRATAVNRVGARLVGIRPARTAMLAYALASLLAGFVGVMVAPVTTIYYDSGFLLSLKAFVAAIIGGLVSYPLTAFGALAVGMFESFGSFYSGALKDVIVFSLLIPVLLARSALTHAVDDEGDEGEEVDG
jgi:branched-chain amino acid transport system permease protein